MHTSGRCLKDIEKAKASVGKHRYLDAMATLTQEERAIKKYAFDYTKQTKTPAKASNRAHVKASNAPIGAHVKALNTPPIGALAEGAHVNTPNAPIGAQLVDDWIVLPTQDLQDLLDDELTKTPDKYLVNTDDFIFSSYSSAIFTADNIVFNSTDLMSLCPNQYLTDNIVNYFIQFAKDPDANPNAVTILPTETMTALVHAGTNYETIDDGPFGITLEHDCTLIVCCTNNHFWLLCIIDPYVIVMDSIGMEHPREVDFVMDYLNYKLPSNWQTFNLKVPKQENTYDCGYFTWYNAFHMARNYMKFSEPESRLNTNWVVKLTKWSVALQNGK